MGTTLDHFIHLLIILITITATTKLSQAQNTTDPLLECSDFNFTTNSTYGTNLKRLLPDLTAATVSTGYDLMSEGSQETGQVFGIGLCRGDVSKDKCRDCLSASTQLLHQNCPQSIKAVVWEEYCMLRYTNTSITYTGYMPGRIFYCSEKTATKVHEFESSLKGLLGDLASRAAYGSSNSMFATGDANYSGSSKVYGMMQCTRDLTPDQCYNCLMITLGVARENCWVSEGGVVAGLSCFMRFETYSFFNGTTGTAPPPPALLASPTTSTEEFGDGSAAGGRKRGLSSSEKLVIIVTPVVSLLVCAMAIVVCLWRRRRYIISISSIDDEESKQPETQMYNLSTLREATNNFSSRNKLGEGGFGAVYKGVLTDGLAIAVKKLSQRSKQGLTELRNEVVFVAKLQHKNLVRLLGYCLEEKEKLVVYEFLPNGSLDKFLIDQAKRRLLDWQFRHKIIEGIAKGLLYLHEDSQLTIVHRDLKASNILLDENMNAKISDFGLARLFDVEKSCESASQIAGTRGYMAPEYVLQGHFATRSDVYSYGVLVLEIVTGRKVTDFDGSGKYANILSYAWNCWNKQRALDIVDTSFGELLHYEQEVLRCIHIGLLCVQKDPTKRPNMASVVLMLNSYSVTLPSPSIPGFFVEGSTTNDAGFIEEKSVDFDKADNRNNSALVSANYVSVTISEPR